MQNASNQISGDPWLKKGFATNFETRPRTASSSHYFCSFFYWSFQCNFVSFLAGRNAAGCPTEYFLWILNKRTAAGATFQCLDRRQKELIPSIWSSSKNRHYTFKQKHCFICFFFYMCFDLFYIFFICIYLFYFLFFSFFLLFFLFVFYFYFFIYFLIYIFLFFFIFF